MSQSCSHWAYKGPTQEIATAICAHFFISPWPKMKFTKRKAQGKSGATAPKKSEGDEALSNRRGPSNANYSTTRGTVHQESDVEGVPKDKKMEKLKVLRRGTPTGSTFCPLHRVRKGVYKHQVTSVCVCVCCVLCVYSGERDYDGVSVGGCG